MSELRDIQGDFQAFLMTGNNAVDSSIVDCPPVNRDIRLGIYKDAYQLRLVEALASNFPCLQTHLGQEAFQRLGFAYLAVHPSRYRSIRWFGDRMVDYLLQHPEQDYPWLAELAEFEWNMSASFDAQDADVLTMADMAALPAEAWAELTLSPHPSVHRMNFFWNVVPLWQGLTEGKAVQDAAVKSDTATAWVLWRKDYINRFLSLSEEEAWALDAAISGATFADICEGLCAWHEESAVGMRAAGLLKGWILSGLVAQR